MRVSVEVVTLAVMPVTLIVCMPAAAVNIVMTVVPGVVVEPAKSGVVVVTGRRYRSGGDTGCKADVNGANPAVMRVTPVDLV